MVSGGQIIGSSFDLVQGPEDSWSGAILAGGAVKLRVTGECARCAMVETDPLSGAKHGTVLRALARHRRRRARLVFGVFCEPIRSSASYISNREHPSTFPPKPHMVQLVQGTTVEPIIGALPDDLDPFWPVLKF